MNDVFGPIGNEYCLYFYILSVIGMLFFVMVLVGILFTGVTKKMGVEFYLISLLYSFNFLFMYLQNRLLFNMCGNSL
jgi:uncharacterized membrane protein